MAQSGSSSKWQIATGVLAVLLLGAAIAAAAYVFWIDDEDDGGGTSGTISGMRVTSVQFSNEIDANGQIVNPRIAMPAGTRAVRAVVRIDGIQPGTKVEGRWYQLGVGGAGAEGAEIGRSDFTVEADTITNGVGRVSFSLGSGGSALPTDAYLLRVYIGGTLARTSGFVIATTSGAIQPQGGQAPTGSPSPASPAPSGTPRP